MNFIPISQPSITDKEIQYVNSAMKSGWVSSLGEYIEKFEKEFAEYCGAKYALTTSNGTTALHLALESCGIGENDEVIVPELTFIATASAVLHTGANVVIVDINRDTLCIDPDVIEKSITKDTKAIIPVHLYGYPAEMDKIIQIAEKYNLIVIEDAAEAHGAEINGKKVGSIGDISIFSFYGNKIITSGEGGMLVTSNESLYKKAKLLRDHAMSPKKRYWHDEIGFNYRMTNIQAALGLAQFERIDEILEKKKEVYEWYKEHLSNIQGVKLNYTKTGIRNVFWMVVLEIDSFNEEKREEFMQKLKERNIDSRPYFYPLSSFPMFDQKDNRVAYTLYEKGLNLPSYFDITKEQIMYICQVIKELLE